jgi:LuxR family transcriptional regulator, maltose regulon positive regulatory protein
MFLIDNSHDLGLGYTNDPDLITEKITQPGRLSRLSRARLITMLEQSMASGCSTIISGRAGAGKTALVVDFANQCSRPVAWYKVDAPDADPGLFFRYLIRSIREHRPGFGSESLMDLVQAPELALPDRIAWLTEAFVYDLSEGEASRPLLIVIEDLHLVSDSDWLMLFFGRLLPLLPAEVHVVITSRSLPPAPLWRMRSKQSLVVIDEAALAFTRPEAIALFDSYGLSNEQACISLDQTHGRAGALDDSAAFLQRSETTVGRIAERADLRCVY